MMRSIALSVLIVGVTVVPCDAFGLSPSMPPRSIVTTQGGRLGTRNCAVRPALGMSLSSEAPPKVSDKYRLEATGTKLATSDSGKVGSRW